MYQLTQPLFLVCETPLHAGSGDSLGIVDMPIQRERHTGFPKIEASSLKGALRMAFENKCLKTHPKRDNPDIIAAFGPEEGDAQAAALAFTDARLLLFPVKSMKGVFAWITCPRVLRQFERDMQLAFPHFKLTEIPANPAEGKCILLNKDSNLTIKSGTEQKIMLEEYAFTVQSSDADVINVLTKKGEEKGDMDLHYFLAYHVSKDAYFQDKMAADIVLLNDDDFTDFVQMTTEVITRTKISNETGTVQSGALFTEEYLPSESVLYSLVMAAPEMKKGGRGADAMQKVFIDNKPEIFQLGGNTTLGKGLLRTQLLTQLT
jgi:CRISPR-associated protein Cmr4